MSGNNPSEYILKKIAEENDLQYAKASSLAGGDINEVYRITTHTAEVYVLKLNDSTRFPGMFKAEKAGLEALGNPGIFTVPEVINTGEVNGKSYLLLEYIESVKPVANFWELFGNQLADLHKTSAAEFGFSEDNYIGSLPQQNNSRKTAAEFYITQRLEPQFKLAKENGFNLEDPSSLYRRCEELIPNEPPALIHGDLWSGNYLTDASGKPCLIDPAVAFAPREMDLGMMKLFGGFDAALFASYEEHYPVKEGLKERIPLWQLYYLLVHLNIFGAGYKSRVTSIINQYN